MEFAVVTSNDVAESAAFKWGLWITQIKCDGTTSLQSPKGCFQYFLPSSGYLTSFAFDSNGQYLNNQACTTVEMENLGTLTSQINLAPMFINFDLFLYKATLLLEGLRLFIFTNCFDKLRFLNVFLYFHTFIVFF